MPLTAEQVYGLKCRNLYNGIVTGTAFIQVASPNPGRKWITLCCTHNQLNSLYVVLSDTQPTVVGLLTTPWFLLAPGDSIHFDNEFGPKYWGGLWILGYASANSSSSGVEASVWPYTY